jgi:dTMP kinase
MTPRGRLLAFEGIDGCGKTTQARRVATLLDGLFTFEPGDTPLGASLRTLVLDPELPATALAEVLIMAADRAQHLAEVIEPALASGLDVVTDRYSGSTLAYQGYGRGIDLEDLRAVLAIATGGATPDLTILIDCPVDVTAARREGGGDRFEDEAGGFLERVRRGFLALAASDGWVVVDGSGPIGAVSAEVDAALSRTAT